jgi:hypothetical protein
MSALVTASHGSLPYFILLLATAICQADEPAIPGLQVELKVIEVHTAKMKHLGFAWAHLASDGVKEESFQNFLESLKKTQTVDQLDGFLESLRQNGLATVLAEPTIATLSGRPASLRTGGTRLDMVPILLGNGDVRLECRVEIDSPPESAKRAGAKTNTENRPTQFHLDTATDLALGKTSIIGHTRNRPQPESKSGETETLVVARVELLQPGATR